MIVLAPEFRPSEAEVSQALLPMPLPARAKSQTADPAMREAASLRRCYYNGAVSAA